MPLEKKFCHSLKTEAKCAPYTIAHGPADPKCDKYMQDKCGLFNQLYKGDTPFRSCFNNQVGKEYICPKVGLPSPKSRSCHHQNPNIGVHDLCPFPQRGGRKNQKGGGSKKSCAASAQSFCQETYGPNYFNLAALGLQGKVYQPTPSPLLGYGVVNPGTSCNCSQQFPQLATYTPNMASEAPVQAEAAVQEELSPGECSNVPRDESYSCYQKYTLENGCPTFDSTCQPNKPVYQFVCGKTTRCGNGDIAQTGGACQSGCGCDCQEYIPKIWNQPANANRHYGLTQPEEVPGYYLDVSQPMVGNRPIRVQSDRETIPSMLLCNKTNLPARKFDCKQPCWNGKCI